MHSCVLHALHTALRTAYIESRYARESLDLNKLLDYTYD